ncbi:MAG: 6-carboxytetrahydropterin synthase [Verrucomicrobiota bacterium]
MPYRLCRRFEIESGHMLSKHPEKCRFPHGHSRTVECVLEADQLDEREMVCDFKLIKRLLADELERYDHAMCMNTDDPAFAEMKARYGDRILSFEGIDPTTEVLARELFLFLKERLANYSDEHSPEYPLQKGVRLVKLRLSETSSSWAEYFE